MSSRPRGTGERAARGDSILRATLFVYAVVFLSAALFNFGAQLTIGSADLSFPNPIWQAGVGEAVIGLALLAAAFRPYGRGSWRSEEHTSELQSRQYIVCSLLLEKTQ